MTTKSIKATVSFLAEQEEGAEYVVQARQSINPFVEVAKGTASPIVYTARVNPGIYEVRVLVRDINNPSDVEGPSATGTAKVVIPRSIPGNVKLVVEISK